jgi:acetyl esterase/lipase
MLIDLGLAKKAPIGKTLDANSDIIEYRAKLAAMKAARKAATPQPTIPNYEEEDCQIRMRDGSHITVRIHRPKQLPVRGSPVFAVYHSGGFVFGDLDSQAVLCRQWVELGW